MALVADAVGVVEPLSDEAAHHQGVLHRHDVGLDGVEEPGQRETIDELHGDVVLPVGLAEVVDVGDALVRQAGGDPHLVSCGTGQQECINKAFQIYARGRGVWWPEEWSLGIIESSLEIRIDRGLPLLHVQQPVIHFEYEPAQLIVGCLLPDQVAGLGMPWYEGGVALTFIEMP